MKQRRFNKGVIYEAVFGLALLVIAVNEAIFDYTQLVDIIGRMGSETFWSSLFAILQTFVRVALFIAFYIVVAAIFVNTKLKRKLVGKTNLPFNRKKK